MHKKTYLLILAGITFLFPSLVFGQSNTFYTVFVGNYPDPQAEQFSLLKRYGFLYKEDLQQNIAKVYIGGFDNKKAAVELMNKIKPMYTEASVVEQKLRPNNEVTVIQVATRIFNQEIEWQKFEPLQNLYAMIDGDKIKIATGIYPSFEAAKRDLEHIRASGFDDAFIKNVNETLIKGLSSFETGLKKPLIPIQLEDRPVAVSQSNNNAKIKRPSPPAATKKEVITSRQPSPRGYESMIPMNGQPQVQPKSPNASNNNNTYSGVKGIDRQPNIRSQVKRTSVIELQKVLKLAGTYNGQLDGYYGPGTTAGYSTLMQQNRDLQKYAVLSQYAESGQADMRPLQQALNNLPNNPNAQSVIDGSREAIAIAYKAYRLFGSLGPTNEVNQMMNAAIKQAYSGQFQGPAPFDYSATYAYNDWSQLVLHLLFIHGSPNNTYATPCWLVEKHPQESATAQAVFANLNSSSFLMQNCGNFMEWEEIRMLVAISSDMSGNRKVNPQEAAADASLRSQLYTTSAGLEKSNQATYERWNRDLWANLNNWSLSDPLHQRMVTSLKVAYFQTQVRLEDFFMDKGFKYNEASGLALATLESLVGRDLQRFM